MKRWLPPVVLTAIFVLFRVPALLNAGLINSDGAIAGLQARAMLAGEWEWAHWTIVVPEASEDRYPRWRTEFDAQSKVAYVLHPSSPTQTLESIEAQLAGQRLAFEKVDVEGYAVLIVDR